MGDPGDPGTVDAELRRVSCPTARVCVAVGSAYGPSGTTMLAEHWDGATWRIEPVPEPAGSASSWLAGVSCRKGACVAVGSYGTSTGAIAPLTARWDGRTWETRALALPQDATSGRLTAVSCARRRACVAVGDYDRSAGGFGLLSARWDGRRWEIAPVAVPAGVTFIRLADVACARARTCIAVGDHVAPAGTVTLAMRWDGRRWTAEPTPNPVGSLAALAGVSCPGRRACVAVGPDPASLATFAERWDGRAWQLEPMPSAPGAQLSSLRAVSCPTRRACTAVGFSFDATGATVPLALHWSGRG